ncbi:MAG TPA: hypothetical protein VHH14_02605 [Solirubrobacterales bacterium]|nr:hypothetical protein [Solirubrobacterales bacterium]
MATKEDFNAAEWQSVAEAPALAGLMVVTAQRGGTIRESVAMGRAYSEAGQQHRGHDILGEIVSQPPGIDPREFSNVEELNSQGAERIRGAVATLESKASAEEVDAYKQFIDTVATAAAEADKSGGVLGVGGERISEAEQGTLDRIREAVGLESGPAAA